MNADLHMSDDLKNTGKGNLFVIFGEPDITILPEKDGKIRVKVNGVDVFHPNTGEVRSDGADGIACWFIDTDYNEESFFVRHAYFLGANDPYNALKTTLKDEIDAEAWASVNSPGMQWVADDVASCKRDPASCRMRQPGRFIEYEHILDFQFRLHSFLGIRHNRRPDHRYRMFNGRYFKGGDVLGFSIFLKALCIMKKARPPPPRDVDRDSGTASANGGWLRRLFRHLIKDHISNSTVRCSCWLKSSQNLPHRRASPISWYVLQLSGRMSQMA